MHNDNKNDEKKENNLYKGLEKHSVEAEEKKKNEEQTEEKPKQGHSCCH